MNLADITAFVATAETGSVNRAARRLGLTQPAVTRRLQNFEAALGGVPLLDRSSKPPVLTPAGRQVLEHCRRVLAAVSELRASASETGTPEGELRIGIAHGLAEIVLASPLDKLRLRFPDVRLQVGCQWTRWLVEDVRNGGLDCAVALVTEEQTLPPGVSGANVGSEPIVIVSSKDLKLPGNGRRLRIVDLSEWGWVVNTSGCGYRDALQKAFDRAQATMRVSAEVLGYDLQLSLIARGAGLGLIPLRRLNGSAYRRRLRVVQIKDFRLDVKAAVLRRSSLGGLGIAVDHLQSSIAEHLRAAV